MSTTTLSRIVRNGLHAMRPLNVVLMVAAAVAVITAPIGSAPSASAVPLPAPTVVGITPTSGLVAGGQPVVIWGTGFATSGTITVTINGAACTGAALVVAANATALKCTTGAGSRGIGDVVVTNPDTQSGTLDDGFTYVNASDNEVVSWGAKNVGGNGGVNPALYPPNRSRLATALDQSLGALTGHTVVGVGASGVGRSACAVAEDAKAYCWGTNASGELGNGTTTTSYVPVAVSTSGALSGKKVVRVVAGNSHSCALTDEGKAYCWGYNSYYGQLGNNSTTDSSSPVVVSTGAASGKAFVSLSIGENHTCALTSDGKVYCWGRNDYGQLGNNSTTDAKTPVAVNTGGTLSGKTVVAVSVGYEHSCALTSEGKVSCWGSNYNAQIGTNPDAYATYSTPQLVGASGALSGKTVKSLAAGLNHTCVTTSEGLAYCWGTGSGGRLGTGAEEYSGKLPTAVDATGVMSGVTITGVAAGSDHSCALSNTGRLFCWGDDAKWQSGQLVVATTFNSPVEVDRSTALRGTRVLSFSASNGGTVALVTAAGAGSPPAVPSRLVGWGNSAALLGANVPAAGLYERLDPNNVLTGTTIDTVSGNCVLTAAGTVGCWKSGTSLTAIDQTGVLSGKTITKLAAEGVDSYGHACVLTSDNGIYCWGANWMGQLGNNTNTDSSVPVAVDMSGALDGKTVSMIAVGYTISCALTTDDGLYCWGAGSGGLSGATLVSTKVPIAQDTSVLGGKSIAGLSLASTRCLWTTDGLVYCWGSTGFGNALGSSAIGSWVAVPQAVDTSGVLSGKKVVKVATGAYSSCAVTDDNGVYCWGENGNGELGNGSNTDSTPPVAVDTSGALAGKAIVDVSLMHQHVCALDDDGAAYCWGQNQSAGTGNPDTYTYPNRPYAVDSYGLKFSKVLALTYITVAVTEAVEGGDPAPVVTSVAPSSGLALGGTDITVTGENFATTGTVTVTVGGVTCATVVVNSATELTCTTGAGTGGQANVVVTNPDGKSGTGTKAFTYVGPPTIASSSPSTGPIEGGTAITITGTGFSAGATVTIGGNACTDVAVDSATSISCTTPAGTAGAADIVVTNSDTQSGTKAGGFTYGDAVSAVSPTGGTTAGGTPITLTGTGFVSGATITVGGAACTSVVWVSATSMTCTTPAGTAGDADIVVTNPDTTTISGIELFEYVAVPTVTAVSPTIGKAGASTPLTITGTNFDTVNTISVTVGGSACSNIDVTSSTEITCDSPSGSAGTVDITVTNPYSVAGTGSQLFSFIPVPTVTSVVPPVVSTGGGTSITVTGTNFSTIGTVTVEIGSGSDFAACTSVSVTNATTLTCTTPARSAGTLDVKVTNPASQDGTGTSVITAEVGPTVTGVNRAAGAPAGAETIYITGTNFATSGTVTVKVGSSNCTSVVVYSATNLSCTTPAGSVGYADVRVTNPSTIYGTLSNGYRYVPSPDVTSVTPAYVSNSGGSKITLWGTGFDSVVPSAFVVEIGGEPCLDIVVISATQATCIAPKQTNPSQYGTYVENSAVVAYDNLSTAPYYVTPSELIARLFPPAVGGATKQTYNTLMGELRKITDAKGNCQKDLNKFTSTVVDQQRKGLISRGDADTLLSLFTSMCTVQLSGPSAPPPAPLRIENVQPLDVDPTPACSATFSNPAPTLNFDVPDATVTQYSFSRSDFTYAAMWVGVNGTWGPAIPLDPANASASGVEWSTEFVRLLVNLAGVTSPVGAPIVTLDIAFGEGGMGDPYDAGGITCTSGLSLFLGELPETGSDASGIAHTALWLALSGLLLVVVAVRRRGRPAC